MPAVPRIGEGENCIDSLSGSRTAARLDIGYAWGSTRWRRSQVGLANSRTVPWRI